MVSSHDLDLDMPEEETTLSEETTDTVTPGNGGTSDDTSASDDLAKELAIAREAMARAQADYRNLLVRTERERIEMGGYITEKIILKMLPSLDALERIVAFTPEGEREGAVYKGISQAASGFTKTLESLGLSGFVSVGEVLDPTLHEAIMQAPGEDGKIVTEIEKWYRLGDKVIRHAKVVVGNGQTA